MVLLVVLVCVEAQNVTEVRGELGGDVTLTCSTRKSDIYWYMEVHNQLRVNIGRIYSSDVFYSYPDLKTKYLMEENRLVIKNFTADDCRLYFCGEKINGNISVVDTLRLISGKNLIFIIRSYRML